MAKIKIGDKITHIKNGVVGIAIKQYYPTACEQQTMVKTAYGAKYHAPTREWRHFEQGDNEYAVDNEPIAATCSAPLMQDAAAPVMVEHNYRDVKIGENTTITIDLEDISKQLERELYKDFNLYRGLKYLARGGDVCLTGSKLYSERGR